MVEVQSKSIYSYTVYSDGRVCDSVGKPVEPFSYSSRVGDLVHLYNDLGKKEVHSVAVLVATCFLENPANKKTVIRLDNKKGYDISNLMWSGLTKKRKNTQRPARLLGRKGCEEALNSSGSITLAAEGLGLSKDYFRSICLHHGIDVDKYK